MTEFFNVLKIEDDKSRLEIHCGRHAYFYADKTQSGHILADLISPQNIPVEMYKKWQDKRAQLKLMDVEWNA